MNIKQIAEIVGCSPSTVSRVLSSKDGNVPISKPTKDKIMAACKKYNYQPNVHASRFFSKRSNIIGILIPQALYLSDRNLSRFLDGAYRTMDAHGYRMTVFSATEKFISGKNHLNIFKTKEVDGLIIWGCSDDDSFINELQTENYPFILGSNRKGNFPAVICDDSSGMKKLVNYCKSQGAKRFVYVSEGTFDSSRRRTEGFIEATYDCETLRLDFPRNYDFQESDIHKFMGFKPDVIMCINDIRAYDVMKKMQEMGISVPEQVKITGADNAEYAKMVTPAITTYDQMAEECGRRAVKILTDHLDKQKPLTSAFIEPELVIRNSA